MTETSSLEQIIVKDVQEAHLPELTKPSTNVEVPSIEKQAGYSDPRIGKVHRHYEETYSISDESTPEGAKLSEIARKLEGDEFQGKIRYRIINHPQVNAFALGDTVYVFSGLLSKLQNTSEVASVLAHEITHIEKHDTDIHDSTNDPDSVQEAIARLAVPRVREYTADAMVAEKLDVAGYNPTSYQNVLQMFHNLPSRGVDFAHGFSKDRQSAQILQMKLKDYESSSRQDTEKKPPELTEAYLEPQYEDFLFDKLYHLSESEPSDKSVNAEIKKLSPHAILDFHSYLSNRITQQFAWDKKSKGVDSNEIYKAYDLITATDQEVDSRILTAFPKLSSKEAYWMRVVLYTEVMDRRLGELQEPAEDVKRASNGGFGNIDYAGKLVSTLTSEADLLAFTQLVKNHQQVQQLGYEPSTSDFPHTWQSSSKDVFFLPTLKRLNSDPKGYIRSFDIVEKIGSVLGADPGTTAADWTSRYLGEIKTDAQRYYVAQLKRINPRLYDQDTPQAIIQNAPQIKPDLIRLNKEFFAREGKYTDPAQIEEHKNWELRMMAGALYSDLPYDMRDDYEKSFIVEYQRAEDPLLDGLLKLADAKDSKGIVTFIQENGAEAFNKYCQTARLSERDVDFSYKLLTDIQGIIQNEYAPTPEDRKYVFELIRSSNLLTPELSSKLKDLNGSSPEQIIANLGINDRDIRVLLNISYSKRLTIGGNEDRAFGEYQRIVDSINLSEISPNAATLVFNQLIAYGESGGHGLTSWKERHYELDWGKILQSPNLIALRDSYFQSWQSSGEPLRERIKSVRNLSTSLTEFGNKQTREPEANWFGSNQSVATFVAPLVEGVMNEVGSMEVDKGSIDDLKMLHEMVGILDDRRLASKLRSELELQIVKLMDHDAATTYLKELIDKDGFPVKAMDWYQENLIRTPEQLQKAQALMEEYFNDIHENGDEKITAAAGIDYAFENFFTKHSLEVFEAAIESQQDDTKLRSLLAQVWYESYMPNMTTPYRLTIPTIKNGVTEVNIEGGAQHQFVPFETFVESFYKKLGQTEIDILLRKMLISEEGVLMTREGQNKLHGLLMNQIRSTPEDADLINLIDRIVDSGLEVVDAAKLYQPISSILRERLFLAPPTKGSNQEAIDYVWGEYTKRLNESLERSKDSVSRAETTYDRQKRATEHLEHSRWIEENTPSLEDMAKVLEFNPLTTRVGISDALRSIESAKDRLTELVTVPQRETEMEQMEPVEVVLEFSKNMGAVGVRFLQLLGQYVELPNSYQSKFDEVYDQMRGQLKYTAFQTLKRESEKQSASPELHEFWSNLQSLSPTIAGGSTMTVYVATLNDGSERIVKVLNPNAEDFVRQNIVDARAVLEKMKADKPNSSYDLALTLIADLENWLVEDINTTSYEENNRVFEEVNNGFEVTASNGQKVVIACPETTQTGTKYVKVEEYVHGKNVSEIINKEGVDEAKPYVEATIASFKHQTESASPEDGNARVHSDVHIGNVRVGTDGKLYWIDRGYYLEMPSREVEIIKPLLEGQFDSRVGFQAINYLLGLPENNGKGGIVNTPKILADVVKTVTDARNEGKADLVIANNVLLALKKRGIHIPIRFSLFFKNVRAQAKMAERVGIDYL